MAEGVSRAGKPEPGSTPSQGCGGATHSITVLVVDPHVAMRAALVAALEAQPGIAVIASVSSLDEGLAIVGRGRPQVMLLDAAALGDSGVRGLGALRPARSSTAILVIGVVDDPALDYEAVRQGAVGRVLKDEPAETLAAAIRAAAGRRRHLHLVPPAAESGV